MDERTRSAICIVTIALFAAGCASSRQPPLSVRLERTAEMHYRAGNLSGAQGAYKALLKIKPKYTPAYLRLGAIAYQRGNSEQAKQHFESALKTNPKSAQATYNLGMLSLNEASERLHDYLDLARAGSARERVLRMLESLEQFE
jgi:tetratricopeptide (TPR) repeat protein